MSEMFWLIDTGSHFHIHCELPPEEDAEEMRVIQVQIIPHYEDMGVQRVVQRVVDDLNSAARYWARKEFDRYLKEEQKDGRFG